MDILIPRINNRSPIMTQAEKVFIYAITKEFSLAQSIIDDLSQKQLSELENKMLSDSNLILFVSEHPDCYNKKSPNNQILKARIDACLEKNPVSIIGLHIASIYALYLRNYAEALLLIQRLDHLLPNNEKVIRLQIYVYFHLHNYNKSLILLKTLKSSSNIIGEKFALQFLAYPYIQIIIWLLLSFLLLLVNPYWILIIIIAVIIVTALGYATIVKNEIILSFGLYLFVGCLVLIIGSLILRSL